MVMALEMDRVYALAYSLRADGSSLPNFTTVAADVDTLTPSALSSSVKTAMRESVRGDDS